MRFRRHAIGLALGLCFSVLSGEAVAGLEEGFAAYQQGDYATALREFRPLAVQGDAVAQFAQFVLGVMYDNGQGVAQDYQEAAKWYRLAAAQGNAFAQSNLGMMYDRGQGVAQDYQDALKWYRLAAMQGNAFAQSNLGVMYEYGRGVPSSPVAAYALYNLAAANDPASVNKASANRTRLIHTMSPKEIEAGQALTRELSKPGNLLKALDQYVKTRVSKSAR